MKRTTLFLLFPVLMLAVACEKVPLTSPTGSTISLAASSTIVPVNGSVEITATVIELAGTAVQNGTTVTFISDFGRLDPSEARTVNGRATVRFVADGRSGTVKINAISGAATTSGATSGALTLLVGGAAAGRLTLRADPPNMPQAGGTVQIFANVTDINGNPLAGAPVSFTIATGTTATGTGILSNPSAVTDANGVAQTALTTNQTTTVTATVATPATGTSTTPTANVTVTALPAPTIAFGTDCAATASVGVAYNCTITPTVAAGGSLIVNVTVNWGDGTGEQPLATGAAVASHSYTSPNTYTITAAATDQNGQRGTAVRAVVVTRNLPSGTLIVPTAGTAGVAVSMSYSPSTTTGQATTSVQIDFGDGSAPRTFSPVNGTIGFTKTYATEGGYTVTARPTDASGQQGQVSAAIVISRGTAPTTVLTQTDTTGPAAAYGTNESFSVTASVAAGLTVRSVVVRNVTLGEDVYSGSSGATFVTNRVQAGDLLRSTITDSNGATGTFDLIVK